MKKFLEYLLIIVFWVLAIFAMMICSNAPLIGWLHQIGWVK